MQVELAENKTFRILACLEEENTLECMGFIRFVEVDKQDDLTNLYVFIAIYLLIITNKNLYETNKQRMENQ